MRELVGLVVFILLGSVGYVPLALAEKCYEENGMRCCIEDKPSACKDQDCSESSASGWCESLEKDQ